MPSSSASTPPMKRCRPMLSTPTMRNPRFAAAPIRPAMSARDLLGQISLTSATPSDHSPPMPSDATNRSAAMCHASVAKPHRPGEDRVRENAQRHRADAADAIAKPAEEHAAGGRAHQEHGDDRAEPLRRLRGRRRSQQIVQRRAADQREQPHLEAVEHPTQQGGRQCHPSSEIRFGNLRHDASTDGLPSGQSRARLHAPCSVRVAASIE